jgi:hypothetical protein
MVAAVTNKQKSKRQGGQSTNVTKGSDRDQSEVFVRRRGTVPENGDPEI